MNPIDHAQRAAHQIQLLNRASRALDAYEWPGDVDVVIGALESLASQLPQALAQASDWLEHTRDAGGIGHDEGADPHDAVSGALGDLNEAQIHAVRLAAVLGEVRATTYHLTGVTDQTPTPLTEGVPW